MPVVPHVRWRHSVSVPGQAAAVKHCTQLVPLQTVPPFGPEHAVPCGLAGCDGAPAARTSSVQLLPSSAGLSPLSSIEVTPPLLSQTAFLQLPTASGSAAVPAVAFEKPQVFWFPHTRWRQIVSVPEQSVAIRQATQAGVA